MTEGVVLLERGYDGGVKRVRRYRVRLSVDVELTKVALEGDLDRKDNRPTTGTRTSLGNRD